MWWSVWGAKFLLLEGLKWRVGDRRDIKVWDDARLPDDSFCLVPTPNLESPANLRVADFIHENGGWDDEAVSMYLTEADKALVLEIPLSERKPSDVLYWWLAIDEIYSTKFGYWLGKLGHLRGWAARFGGDNSEIWRTVWNIGGRPS